MSNYTKSTNFAAKDSLPSGNAGKVVKGTEINTEFDNIATAIATKADLNSPTLVTPNLGTPSAAVLTNATGLPLTTGVTGTLPVANGGTGANTFSAGALLKGAGTSAITTATAGTDYAPATSGTSILKGNGSGGFSSVVSGTDIKTINSTSLLGSGDIAITSTPGGSNTQVQYNNAGAFGGSANFVFDGTNVGIGTSSPSYLLHAAGTNPRINVSASSTGYAGYRASNTSGTFQVAIDDSTGSNYLGTAYGRVIYSDGAYPLQFATNATERMRITSGGNLLVGTTTNNASGGVIQVSNGITFPATQSASSDANTLDDYEEGAWTPAYAAATGSFNSITYGVRGGRYTKIGNTVTLWFIIQINSFSVGTASGNLTITGIPFNVASSVNNRSAGAVSNCNSFTTGNNPEVITSISSTSLSLYKRTSAGGAQSANQVSDLSNSCEFAGCFVYEAA